MSNIHSLESGQTLNNGQYEIISVLGSGATAIVYLAKDLELDMPVAIKEYFPLKYAKREENNSVGPCPIEQESQEFFSHNLSKFDEEARLLASFTDPNIVTIHCAFKENDTSYFVMEYCEKGTLKDLLKQTRTLSEPQVIRMLSELAVAVSNIHRQDIIHRDIKPSNVGVRESGSLALLDFGSARKMSGDPTVHFSPHFSSKEHQDGEPPSPSFDIYGLGALAYYCLTGVVPPDSKVRKQSDTLSPIAKSPDSSNFLHAIDVALSMDPKRKPRDINTWMQTWNNNDKDTETTRVVTKSVDKNEQCSNLKWKYIALTMMAFTVVLPYLSYSHIDDKNKLLIQDIEKDIHNWFTAEKTNTIKSYEKYLKTEGRFGTQAKQNIRALQSELNKVALTIKTIPADATVKLLDIRPKYHQGIRLAPKNYRIRIEKKGFDSITTTVDLNAQQNQFHFAMTKTYTLDEGVAFTMQSIPAGHFQMGSHTATRYEQPVHKVSVGSFLMMQTEVTYALWDLCERQKKCRTLESHHTSKRKGFPVVNVSFKDITEDFIPWLNSKSKNESGHPFMLPTEAQWEYAARAGSNYNYPWGDEFESSLARVGFDTKKQHIEKHTVRTKNYKANAFGLFDMHGNASEWVQDCWRENYISAPENGLYREPIASCTCRVKRGGSWKTPAYHARSASRTCSLPTKIDGDEIGFRLVQANSSQGE